VVRSDHAVVSSSLYFSDAPRGTLLRDAFSLVIAPHSGPWKVYVGLWNATGDGSRLRIRQAASAETADDRVMVGSFSMP
jgi:hypothetical protein